MRPAGLAARYLRRIGVDAPRAADAAGLRALHRAHLRTVPFENLDIHLGVPITLGEPALEKIVVRHRGGFCYELNSAFATLLGTLGFTVRLLEARVYADGGLGIRYDHMCLLVECPDGPYLADVGFGAFLDEPIRLAPGIDQTDRNGVFRIAQLGDDGYDVYQDGARQYRFDLTPRTLADFTGGLRFHQSPASHFAKGPVCTVATGRGRLTVSGLKVTETAEHGRTSYQLDPSALPAFLADRFGVRLTAAEADRLARSA